MEAANVRIVVKEKAATRESDALAAERRRQPMTRIEPYEWWRRHDEYPEGWR